MPRVVGVFLLSLSHCQNIGRRGAPVDLVNRLESKKVYIEVIHWSLPPGLLTWNVQDSRSTYGSFLHSLLIGFGLL